MAAAFPVREFPAPPWYLLCSPPLLLVVVVVAPFVGGPLSFCPATWPAAVVVVALMVDARAGPPPAAAAAVLGAVVAVEEVPDLAVASLNEGCRLMLDEAEVVLVVLVVEARADCGIAADEGLNGASCLVYRPTSVLRLYAPAVV